MEPRIHKLKLSLSNAYVLQGERPILVDTGSPKDMLALRAQLRRLGIEPSDIALIAHTHIHSDHAGNTARLADEIGCPVAYHPADQRLVEQSHNGRLRGIGLRGAIMSRVFSNSAFDPFELDVALEHGTSLAAYGVDTTIWATPGHTAGSVSFLIGDRDAIVGDIIMGGFMGGVLATTKPNFHYFAEDCDVAMKSLGPILSATSGSLFVGHGGPLAVDHVRTWYGKRFPQLIHQFDHASNV